MDFEQHIDRSRVQRAEAAYNALQQAVRDAEAALQKAREDAETADRTASASASRGDNAKALDAAEMAVDAANRAARTAERLLEAAKKRLADGEKVRRQQVKLAHGQAANAAVKAKLKALARAQKLMEQLNDVDAEFREAHDAILRLHRQAGREPPSNLMMHATVRTPLDAAKLVDDKDLQARLRDCGWDGAAFGWTRESN